MLSFPSHTYQLIHAIVVRFSPMMGPRTELFYHSPKSLPRAFRALPSLQRFSPFLRPRQQSGPSGYLAIWSIPRHLNHDLGVCLYAGASLDQQGRIADLLAEIYADGNSPVDLLAFPNGDRVG